MSITRDQILQLEHVCRVYQARADDALQPWAVRAPPPVAVNSPEYVEKYRRELAYLAKKRLPENHELRNFQVKHIPLDALEVVEPQIYAACKKAAARNDSVPLGEMRRVEEVDGNGMKIVKWIGQRSFVHDFTIPGRRARIWDDHSKSWYPPQSPRSVA
jgi:hypothetical protein